MCRRKVENAKGAENQRPENWERPDPYFFLSRADSDKDAVEDAYEAGADAIYTFAFENGKAEGKAELLEELKSTALIHVEKGEVLDSNFQGLIETNESGLLVVIPEESAHKLPEGK